MFIYGHIILPTCGLLNSYITKSNSKFEEIYIALQIVELMF